MKNGCLRESLILMVGDVDEDRGLFDIKTLMFQFSEMKIFSYLYHWSNSFDHFNRFFDRLSKFDSHF